MQGPLKRMCPANVSVTAGRPFLSTPKGMGSHTLCSLLDAEILVVSDPDSDVDEVEREAGRPVARAMEMNAKEGKHREAPGDPG